MKVTTKLIRCEWPPSPGVMPGDRQFDDLLESIKTIGIKEPITIKLDWFIIDGNHRLYAARLLGIEIIEVRIWTGTEFVQ